MKKQSKELLELVIKNEELIMKALTIEILIDKEEYKPLIKKPSKILRINEVSGVVPVRGSMR